MTPMKICKIFISQPMNGLPVEEILDRQDKYEKIILDYLQDKDVLPIFLPHVYSDRLREAMPPLFCFAKGIEAMAEADIVVLAGEWYNARGCRLERDIASAYGINIMTVNSDNQVFCDEGLIL